MKKLICQRHPVLYFLSVAEKRFRRRLRWIVSRTAFAHIKSAEPLSYRIKKHQSVLLKKLGESDMILQHNKVDNLKIALPHLNGILIRPGETFSFCRLVGNPTRRKGYKQGMVLSCGAAIPGIGGGICQISNLLYWLVLHSPLTVVERHHHSFDPFPDTNRVLPFGSGATVFYNYIDFQFRNDTPHTYQVNLWLSKKCLDGEIRCDTKPAHTYHVYERDAVFTESGGTFFRKNTICRDIIDVRIARVIKTEKLIENNARVMYRPEGLAAPNND